MLLLNVVWEWNIRYLKSVGTPLTAVAASAGRLRFSTKLPPDRTTQEHRNRIRQLILQREDLRARPLQASARELLAAQTTRQRDVDAHAVTGHGHRARNERADLERARDAVRRSLHVTEHLRAVPRDDIQSAHLAQLVDQRLRQAGRQALGPLAAAR